MIVSDPTIAGREQLLAELIELVEALDRRRPAVESDSESRVARDSAALRADATIRIGQLRAER
jgi:hypothetical protein